MYRYILDKSSRKFICPACRKKRFVKYIDLETGAYMEEYLGRCDREINCSYHRRPKSQMDSSFQKKTAIYGSPKHPISNSNGPSYHTDEDVTKTLNKANNFQLFLNNVLGKQTAKKIANEYKLGTAHFWHDATIFWQIDYQNKIRGGKMIQYHSNGKRTKYINWVHSHYLKKGLLKSYDLKQCLFGEHLVGTNHKPIAIVESEKTACIMCGIFPKFNWLACGSLNGIKEDKLHPIKKRKIVLYPDLGDNKKGTSPYLIWKNKGDALSKNGYDIQVSKLLEENGTLSQRRKGYDIADYFLEIDKSSTEPFKEHKIGSMQQLQQRNINFNRLVETFDLVKIEPYPAE